MLIDCDTCTVRDVACDDCVVTFLLASPPVMAGLPCRSGSTTTRPARCAVLADHGLVPPLRLAQGE